MTTLCHTCTLFERLSLTGLGDANIVEAHARAHIWGMCKHRLRTAEGPKPCACPWRPVVRVY